MLHRIILATLLVSSSLMAQVVGRVSGTVSDASGAVLPDVSVSLRLPGSDNQLYTTSTNNEGIFALLGVRSDAYDVYVEKSGFKTLKITSFVVDAARDTVLNDLRLEVASVRETIEVSGELQGTNTVSAQISNTLRGDQIKTLPMINRDPTTFVVLQAGVNSGRGATTINGLRVSLNNLTLDGINIQDNFLRDNALDFIPNRLLLDSIAEMTVTTSNADNNTGFGAGQVNYTTPSGGNKFHGALLWTNRNDNLASNSWFNNRDGIAKAQLNQNQVGANAGGPIKKDKLFFYSHWEILRNRQQATRNRTILTDEARQGIYTYRDTTGVVRKANVLSLFGVQADPYMQGLLAQVPTGAKINNFRVGDSSETLLRNTAGYSFLGRANNDRDSGLMKIDYNLNTSNAFAFTYNGNRDTIDRGDQTNEYSAEPSVKNDATTKFLSTMWRWNPTSTLTNEARGGFNLAPGLFINSTPYDRYLVTGMSYSSPINTTTRSQGRYTDTYNFTDNLGYVRGNHTFQVGTQIQRVRVAYYDEFNITPTYGIGMGTGNPGLTSAQLPGISANDLAGANLLLASLAGFVTSSSQTFHVKSRTSGFVPGQMLLRNLKMNQLAFYGSDRWKPFRRLTLTMGVRWDYYSPVDERDGLALMPILQNNNAISTLLDRNGTLDFAGGDTGRRFYKQDKNNFAPNFGFSYDLFGTGKTVLRGGYSIAFANDQAIAAIFNNPLLTNSGLQSDVARTGLTGRVSTSLPAVATPTLKVPRTYADNYALTTGNAQGIPDPGLVTPYVQQFSFGIQHEIKRNVIEVRWVGNHATKQFRAFDYNQVVIRENGFLNDFIRDRGNE